MKRITKYFILFEVLLLCVGCNKKKLECIKTDENEKVKTIQKVEVTFSKNKVETYNNSLVFEIANNNITYRNLLVAELKKDSKEYSNKEGIEFKIIEDKTNINVNINAKISNLSKEEMKILGFDNEYGNYKETQKALENSNYSCK